MFEVGKEYHFCTIGAAEEGLGDSEAVWEVVGIDGTLLSLRGPGIKSNPFHDNGNLLAGDHKPKERGEMVLNTASCFFHSARPFRQD
ncbi:hypothetical protein [Oceaniovalibus sp. ACAM 378]|uniref:hypothetical protein n=1 Tax=Oceaniovalibus sp. ACAM 378 TaxID=2599923 RepID=UPI0011D9DC89|nr:hypothetical protein [Oceaniovalibus sp. ACAM 378]TYB83738.1 hypothetical protein FQ320_24120 [Oceaniovalibus sp. ACAM 378]